MLGEKIKLLRQQHGYSQATLAEKLSVVRQTVSKWEKGLSVPDAEMLTRIADAFEISVAELLGAKLESDRDINEVAGQLAQINEQLAIRNRRWRRIGKTLLGIFLGLLIAITLLVWLSSTPTHLCGHPIPARWYSPTGQWRMLTSCA